MNDCLRILFFSLVMAALLMTGCTGENLTSLEAQDHAQPAVSSPDSPLPALRFTGRDSFGVALKGKVSGTSVGAAEGRCPSETVSLTGTGTATHMGRIRVTQSHCVDPSDDLTFTDGQFTFIGTTGAEISGRYEGTLEPTAEDGVYTIHARVWVTSGTVRFREEGAEGRATVLGTAYAGGRFTYELDGWLLHHVREGR